MLYDYSSKVAPRRRYGLQQTDERGLPLVKTRALCGASYEQAYTLPDEVNKDAISAKVEDGILTIELPKLAPEPEKKMDRVIEIG